MRKKSFRQMFWQRLFLQDLKQQFPQVQASLLKTVWIHAASFGEVQLALKIIAEWKKYHPAYFFIITTNTKTGREVIVPQSNIIITWAPFDFNWLIKKFLKVTDASALLLIETEIWPNMIRYSAKKCPVIVLNALLSDRTFQWYSIFKIIFRTVFKKIELFIAGDQSTYQKLLKFGLSENKIYFYGNFKFMSPPVIKNFNQEQLRNEYGLHDHFIFVAGSIQPEEVIPNIAAYLMLLPVIKELRLILIPRHPDKLSELLEQIHSFKLPCLVDSQMQFNASMKDKKYIYLIDRMGVLNQWYSIANAIFVGGSLCQRGGQNILEAAALSKPVCTGPYTFNFKEEVDLLTQNQALKIVTNQHELADFILSCYQEPTVTQTMGLQAGKIVRNNIGGLEKAVQHVLKKNNS